MRLVLLVPGIVVVIIGVVLTLTPTSTVRTQTATSTNPIEFNATTLWSASGTYPLTFSWGAPAAVAIVAATCTSVGPGSTSRFSVCGGFDLITEQYGVNGGFSVAPSVGAVVFLWVLPPNQTTDAPPVTVRIVGANPTLGSSLLLAGAGVIVAGLVLRRKKGAADGPTPPVDSFDPAHPPAWAEQPPPIPPQEWD